MIHRLLLNAVPGTAATRAMSTTSVPMNKARAMTKQALKMIGWDDEDAGLQAEIMTAAELCGNNQGLVKMYVPALMAPAKRAKKPTVERNTPTSAVVNANQSPGMLAAVMAADLAVEKVKASEGPIAIVGAKNTSTSSGQLAFYARRMAEQGVVGVVLANSPEFVAAAAGGDGVFGTNPIAFGIPQPEGAALTFDMATSAIALFGVLTAKAQGAAPPRRRVREGRRGLHDGRLRGARGRRHRHLRGPQGGGPRAHGGAAGRRTPGGHVLGSGKSKKKAKNWGHTFIAIQPDGLVDDFEAKAATVLAAVKKSGPDILLPGETSAKTMAERSRIGSLPIPTAIWEKICRTAEKGLAR